MTNRFYNRKIDKKTNGIVYCIFLSFLFFVTYCTPVLSQCKTAFGSGSIIHYDNPQDYTLADRFPNLNNLLYEMCEYHIGLDCQDHPISYFIYDDSNDIQGNAIALKIDDDIDLQDNRSKKEFFEKYNWIGYRTNKYYIGFGENLLKRFLKVDTDEEGKVLLSPELLFLLYHEFAHIYKYEYFDEIKTPRMRPEIEELNADFMAGMYLGTELLGSVFGNGEEIEFGNGEKYFAIDGTSDFYRIDISNVKDYNPSPQNYSQVLKNFRLIVHQITQYIASIGDETLNQANPHGTAGERIHAFVSGLELYLEEFDLEIDTHKEISKDLNNRISKHKKSKKRWEKLKS